VAEFRAAARAGPTGGLEEYHGSPVPVLGVRTPEFRRILRPFDRELGPLPPNTVRLVLRSLFEGGTFEERIAAFEILDRRPAARDAATWRLVNGWVDRATGWALSDSLAAGPIAAWVAAEPKRFADLLAWTRSPNPWRRRASTYALHDWVRAGALDRPFELLERLVDDPEFWVQRALGTWLRECWKVDPRRTERFLRTYVRRLAPVTITVATERAPERFRASLRKAHGPERRPAGREGLAPRAPPDPARRRPRRR
jgi:3-methyladenine DNA glycosylase AlkD